MDITHLLEYFPIDRWHSLASGIPLPERSTGACLFADISGFTVLTEMLRLQMGARLGSEELSRQINRVYDALIAQVDAFHGVVISFAGDAITCWFDDNISDGALRAMQCALNMQEAMRQFQPIILREDMQVHMALKVAVATGTTRRFLVGDPDIQRMETLVGETLVRMSDGEHLANKGDVMLDAQTVERLGERVRIHETRLDEHTGLVYSVLNRLEPPLQPSPWEAIDTQVLQEDTVKQWLLPPVYDRLKANAGDFLTEMRPCVIFFLRFEGIDYEHDPEVGSKLDRVVRTAQGILQNYGAWLLQLTIGDKGSYLYGAVGAPIAHEDDASRICRAMLGLRAVFLQSDDIRPVQIGIASGLLRTGAYGAANRKTYGVLGDDVNLSARLMQAAVPGEILASETIYRVVSDVFRWDVMTPIHVKGKRDAIAIYRLLHDEDNSSLDLLEPKYAVPMIGRAAELAHLLDLLKDSHQTSGHLVWLTGEAGMGKSRLIAEFTRQAHALGNVVYGGACPSWGTQTAWLVWRYLLRAFLGLEADLSPQEQQTHIEQVIQQMDANLLERIPLLNDILSLNIADTPFTAVLDPKERKSSLEAFLMMLLRLRAETLQQAHVHLVLVLEDTHWIDASSLEFLSHVGQMLADLPVLIVAAQRTAVSPLISLQEGVFHIELGAFSADEMGQLIDAKLEQHYPDKTINLPEGMRSAIVKRAEGNPFYIEELLNYLHDEQLSLTEVSLEHIPVSLVRLILSRIDRLSERQRVTLKVASIIGRMFDLRRLSGYYPDLGDNDRVQGDLNYMSELEITPLDQEEPEIIYLFKHVLTQEVTYTSLANETRMTLHEQFAAYLETQENLSNSLDLIAWHYGLSGNRPKKLHYYELAGQGAAARFANTEAVYYFTQALQLRTSDEMAERYALHSSRERVHYHLGDADAQLIDVEAMQTIAEALHDPIRLAEAKLRYSYYDKLTSNFAHASQILTETLATIKQQDVPALLAEIYCELAQALFFLGDMEQARERATEGLNHTQPQTRQNGQLHRTLGMTDIRQGRFEDAKQHFEQALHDLRDNITDRAFVNADLANLAFIESDFAESRRLLQESLEFSRMLGNSLFTSRTLTTLAAVIGTEGVDLPAAQAYLQQALPLARRSRDRMGECHVLNNLGFNALVMGAFAEADKAFGEALILMQEADSKYEIALLLNNRAIVALYEGRYTAARSLLEESILLKQSLDDPVGIAESETYLAWILMEEGTLQNARNVCQQSIDRISSAGAEVELARAWYLMGRICLLQQDDENARNAFQTSLDIRRGCGMDFAALEPSTGLALVAVAKNDLIEARYIVEEIHAALSDRSADGLEDAIFVYWGWWRALQFLGDTSAGDILETAYQLIISRTHKMTTHPPQTTFLEAVAVNGFIVTEWQAKQK